MKAEFRVLVIEDDLDDLLLTQEALRQDYRRRYLVTHAPTVKKALSLASDSFDVILLDLILPDSNGLNTIIEVQHYFPNTPVIILSGLNDDGIGEEAIQLGVGDYLAKSDITPSLLSRSIRFSMERFSLMRDLKDLAHVDPLTLLPNRADFMQKLEHHHEYSVRHGTQMALCMLDLDGFKGVNDSLGHRAGDQVLQQFSARLKSRVRKSDVIARLGGDEFVVLMLKVENEQACRQAAQYKMKAVSDPFLVYIDGQVQKIDLGMSIGICISSPSIKSPDKLMHYADQAMYQVKRSGKNDVAFFIEEQLN